MKNEESQLTLFDLDSSCGRMCSVPSVPQKARTSVRSSKKLSELRMSPFQFLDLTMGRGNLLGQSYWEENSAWLGECSTLNTGESPSAVVASSLSQILEEAPHPKYYLSKTACLGILRRARERGKELPPQLKIALELQGGLTPSMQIDTGDLEDLKSYHINQRNEGIDLDNISGALMATQNMQMQTFIKEPLYCLNDHGGQRMDIEIEKTPTLRAGMGTHPPLVPQALYDNHARDCRYDGPLEVAPTLAATYGTGGNNIPLVNKESYCIAGNIIDREVKNGGNGLGCQEGISYTLTGMDRHAVLPAPSVFCESSFGGFTEGVSTLCASGGTYGGGSENLAITHNLVRRLTPRECERLQGFPEGRTDIPKASDSPRYKALGNSVAIPCVSFILRGIVHFLNQQQSERE